MEITRSRVAAPSSPPEAPRRTDAEPLGLRQRLKRLFPRRLLIQRLAPSPTPAVLLTFDDGPSPEVTPSILASLERYGARALFFVVGRYVRRAPALLRRIRAEGHLIGNHSHVHHNRRYVTDRLDFWLYRRDLERCQREVGEASGAAPLYFRPPGGRIAPTTLLAPLSLGLRCVRWSLDSNDWRCRTIEQARRCAARTLERIGPGDIVLLHDTTPASVEMLDLLLPGLRDRGFDLRSGLDRL